MRTERYLVEVSITDLHNSADGGGREVKKMRFSIDTLIRNDLIMAMREEILSDGLRHEPLDQVTIKEKKYE